MGLKASIPLHAAMRDLDLDVNKAITMRLEVESSPPGNSIHFGQPDIHRPLAGHAGTSGLGRSRPDVVKLK